MTEPIEKQVVTLGQAHRIILAQEEEIRELGNENEWLLDEIDRLERKIARLYVESVQDAATII